MWCVVWFLCGLFGGVLGTFVVSLLAVASDDSPTSVYFTK